MIQSPSTRIASGSSRCRRLAPLAAVLALALAPAVLRIGGAARGGRACPALPLPAAFAGDVPPARGPVAALATGGPAPAAGDPALAAGGALAGADWPMWGGAPGRNMVNGVEKNIPSSWDIKSRKNIKWVAELGSQTYSNPVIAGGKVFIGTNNQLERNPRIKEDRGILMCISESDGKFLWQAAHDKLASGSVNDWPEVGICSTAAVEGGRVYYVSNRAELVCADAEGFLDGENDGPFTGEKNRDLIDGDFIWILDMMEELKVFPHNMATSSPLIVGDLVFIVTSNGVDGTHTNLPSPGAPSFLAADKHTGKVLWKDSSPSDKILHGQWSSPAFGKIGGKDQVVFGGGDGWLYGFDVRSARAADCKIEPAWKFDCNPKDARWEIGGRGTRCDIIATPVIFEDRIFIAVGQDPEHGEGIGHLYCIDPTGKSGDITAAGQVWHLGGKDFHRTIATVAVHDDLIFAADLSGFLNCLDAKTGKVHWKHDLLAAVWGSPAVIDGKVFLGDEDGDVVVLEARSELKVIAEQNFQNPVYSTPAAAHGVLFITNRSHLYAIQSK